jgi:hypothetical protein
VLKELDGSTVSVGDTHTQVLVDGVAFLKNVKPGFVAIAKWKDGMPRRSSGP